LSRKVGDMISTIIYFCIGLYYQLIKRYTFAIPERRFSLHTLEGPTIKIHW